MQYNLKNICIKAICILLFIIVFYILTKNKVHVESFEDAIEADKINYLKLNETYIEPQEKLSLDLLYANYSGEEVNNSVWENKTLNQCTDICNKLNNCVGFTRDLVLDTEPAKCYPNTTINKCYSNRKGDLKQMQNAIKYNSFVKSNVQNILNLCIGDSELTLNRPIFIKSYTYPNTLLGINGDSRLALIDITSDNLKSSCNFRIEKGLDGIGTVSFYHIDTGKYMYRDISNSIILKDIASSEISKTENNQRSSFNIYDSNISSDTIMFKSMPLDGETTHKFITLDGNYLNVSSLNNSNTSNINDSTFYIIDSIVNSNIITNKQNMPMPNVLPMSMPTEMSMPTGMSMPTEMSMSTGMSMPTGMYNVMSTGIPNSMSTGMPNAMSTGMPNAMSAGMPNAMPMPTEMYNTMSMPTGMPNAMPTEMSMQDNPNTTKRSLKPLEKPNTQKSYDTKENFTVNLDKTANLALYNNLFNASDPKTLDLYLNDNYLMEANNNNYLSVYSKKNDSIINKQLSDSINKARDEYNENYELNLEIEKEISNLYLDLNAKNDKIINNLDKMRITDMANDYFFLKKLTKINK